MFGKMETKNKELEMFTFDQIKDEFIGKVGTEKRIKYEHELQMEVLRLTSKDNNGKNKLTQ